MKATYQISGRADDHEPSFLVANLCWLKDQALRLDYIQVLAMLCLMAFGVVFIYSTGQQVGGQTATIWEKQVAWIGVGLAVWLVFSYLDYRFVGYLSPLFYAISVLLLVAVLFFGVNIFGAKRWIRVGGNLIQPTEFAKFGTIVLAAWIATLPGFRINNILHFAALVLVGLIPFTLILKQPDLGSSLVIPAVIAVVVFIANFKWRWITLIGVFGAIALALIITDLVKPDASPLPDNVKLLKGYQKERLLVFFDPDRDSRGEGWSSRQARLAVGSGGMWGKGVMKGTQNALGFLPQTVSHTDFIFSVIAEESGFFGSALLLGAYAALIFAMLHNAFFARDQFGCAMGCAIAVLFFTHSFINLGMNVRLMPITGLPLPLVSYGGSFMVSAMALLGISQSIHMRRKR